MKRILALFVVAAAWVAWSAPAQAAACANPCTAAEVKVHVVYFGATAVNQAINAAANNLYGDPVSSCNPSPAVIRTYRCKRDLDGDPTNGAETCVQAYVAENKGSCEGVQAVDRKETTWTVCPATGGPTQVAVGTLSDENGRQLYPNFNGSDVSYTLCEPVVTGATIQRPSMFDSTESNAFVTPFVFIANRGLESVLNARAKYSPPTCEYGTGDCLRLDVNINKDLGRAIYGNNNLCDWRWLSSNVEGSVARNIGTVMRNRLSGTRRNFNATVLQNTAPGQGNIYIASSGTLVSRVGANAWCGTNASECGENQSTGQLGGGSVAAACPSVNNISMGVLGADRLKNNDNGTPADPHDDFAYRNNSAENYNILKYDGSFYSKANTRCGRYNYWSTERLYFDNDPNVAINGRQGYFAEGGVTDPTIKQAAVQEWINQTAIDASTDPTLISLDEMYFSRARDGAPIFPSKPYNSYCVEP